MGVFISIEIYATTSICFVFMIETVEIMSIISVKYRREILAKSVGLEKDMNHQLVKSFNLNLIYF